MIHMTWWKVHETEEVYREVALKPTKDLSQIESFDISGNIVLIRYFHTRRKRFELWSIRDTVPTQIPFPICDSFLTERESISHQLCDWTISTSERSQYLVAQFCEDLQGYAGIFRDIIYVLVFNDFTSPNYLYRITLPEDVQEVKLSEVDGGNGDFKTILVAVAFKTPCDSTGRAHVYDITTGELIETFSTGGGAQVYGPYVFPKFTVDKLYRAKNKREKITRINWNGKTWSTSTLFLQFPKSRRNHIALCNVTDTLATWNASEYKFNQCVNLNKIGLRNDEPSELVVTDYLRCQTS